MPHLVHNIYPAIKAQTQRILGALPVVAAKSVQDSIVAEERSTPMPYSM